MHIPQRHKHSLSKSMNLPMAVGATAEVYAWELGWVLKLFHSGQSLTSVEAEAHVADVVHRALCETGYLSVPVVGSIVEFSGRYGLLYQRIEGRPMLEILLELDPPAVVAYAHRLADMHIALHTISSETTPVIRELPLQQKCLCHSIQTAKGLSSSVRAAAQQLLLDLHNNHAQLCHGDLHPANVLLTSNGEAVVIDWNDATCGDPLADVARTSLLLGMGAAPPGVDTGMRQAFQEAYQERYFALHPGEEGRSRWNDWLVVMAAARLSEKVTATEQAMLLSYIGANLP